MKELSIEEKAKRYDEALERAKAYQGHDVKCALEEIFPELKESEDERIRKKLVNYFKENNAALAFEGISNEGVVAWLEKQGEHANFRNKIQIGDEVTRNKDGVLVNLSQLNRVAKKDEKQGKQKPADMVEPDFKVKKGKWYVCINTFVSRGKIIAIKGQTYQSQQEDDTITCEDNCLFIDRHDGKAFDYFKPWTIKDAKDGDVLVASDSSTFIFAYIKDWGCAHHIALSTDGVLKINEGLKHFWETAGAVLHPATKEQRDQLEKAIADAGYTFDFDKKELKKIEQKPAQSEEDEEMLNSFLHKLEVCDLLSNKECTWIKNKLKSLKPQNTWKPSDEQMKSLRWVIEYGNTTQTETLKGIYEQLKKLKEE